MPYLNLNVTSKTRLEILKRNAEKLNNGHNIRKANNDDTPFNWRDVRYSGFHNVRANQCQLSSGWNGETKIWYCHTGQYFEREKFADEVLGLSHTGWFENDCGDTIRGLVAALSGGRFLAGYCMSSNDERVYYPDVFDDESDAAVFADKRAEQIAEECREAEERYQEALELENVIESKRHRLRELVILTKAGLDYAREQMRDVARQIRQARRELDTGYAGVL